MEQKVKSEALTGEAESKGSKMKEDEKQFAGSCNAWEWACVWYRPSTAPSGSIYMFRYPHSKIWQPQENIHCEV